MPLSEHEQRMLEQIESALYAEDPKFASSVKRRRIGPGGGRRRLQAAAIFVVGLVLLVGGIAVDVKLGGFPIISLIGFLVMFGACLMALWGGGGSASGSGGSKGSPTASRNSGGSRRKLSERMEERFNRRFDQDQ
ncbi:hypothetical protein GOEFS_081_00330 [Gordonia effusa NBRC 100432]|uniref:Transmembrane protein n=1 Tax=Gordonia effusa NBRC 100432 TaxID=1077974 RepID=H0R2P2_9ACTN|nr:DUF3040 domain-containing protein [Gordonia effusa]GAB19343.1 hypothetical protein GOEFS_081_00330 [Gordonia effusa NBRC 100432]